MATFYPNNGFSHYTTIILQIGIFRCQYLEHLTALLTEFNLSYEDEEPLYDWLVNEALSRILRVAYHVKVDKHYRHDIYKCIYDRIGNIIEQIVAQQIQIHKLQFLKDQYIKTVVAGDNIIIVRGVASRG